MAGYIEEMLTQLAELAGRNNQLALRIAIQMVAFQASRETRKAKT